MTAVPRLISALVLLALGSCVSPPPPPAATPVPPPMARPAPSPVARPLGADWRDWPVSPGGWSYAPSAEGSIARFGVPGAPADFTLRCVKARHEIVATRTLAASTTGMMRVRTSSATFEWPLVSEGASGVATRAASDAALDAMAYSRGRFALETGGVTPLVLPVWAEFARVIEDCRS